MMGGTESSQKPKAVTGNNKKGTQVRPVHTLSEAHAKFPGVQSTEFPEGWMERVIPRHNKTTFKGDRYFYSPKCQFIFRSRPEVIKFLGHLEETNGDENKAIELYRGIITSIKLENAKVSKVEVQQQQQSDLVLDGKRQRKAVVTLEPMISSSSSLLTTGFQSLKEKSSSYFGVGGQKRKSSSMEGEGQKTLSLDVPSKKKKKQEEKSPPVVRVGDIGYKFRKQFDDGWYSGEVIEIRPGAAGGKDRRCLYEDGDSEDLSLVELQTLALLDPKVTKKKAGISTVYQPEGSKIGVELPLPQYGRYYKKSEAVLVITQFPKGSAERTLAVKGVHAKGYVPISTRNIYKLLAKDEQGIPIEDTPWQTQTQTESRKEPKSMWNPNKFQDAKWEERFNELKKYKKIYGDTPVPTNYPEAPKLFWWIQRQRQSFRNYVDGKVGKASMTEERIARLKSIGFVFNPNMSHLESEEFLKSIDATPYIDDGTKPKKTKSGRQTKQPRKADEIYSYEHIQRMHTNKKTRVAEDPSSPDKKGQLLSSSFDDIPVDTAAEMFSFNAAAAASAGEKDSGEGSDGDDNEWLEKVAASLGANTSNLQQKSVARPVYRSRSTASSMEGSAQTLKSSAITSSRLPTTITCTSDKKASGKYDGDTFNQPPQSQSESADGEVLAPLPLLSEIAEGDRHECLVYHKNDSKRLVMEVIMEQNTTQVMVAVDGKLKQFRAKELFVVPSDEFKVGDIVPKSRTTAHIVGKKPKSSQGEKKPPALSVGHLFCWFCESCDSNNKVFAAVCHSCKKARTDKSKRSILLQIAEKAVEDKSQTVEEAMESIPFPERSSIPEKLIENLLAELSGGSTTDFNFEPSFKSVSDYFYWMCGSCTMKNAYMRTTCSACAQGKSLAEQSPLLKVAAEAANGCQTTDDAMLKVPQREKLLMPRVVMDALVTCVYMIEGQNGQQRRCLKKKKRGFDYCEGHIHPSLINKPRVEETFGSTDSYLHDGSESMSFASLQGSELGPSVRSRIAAINSTMPSFLIGIQQSLANDRHWSLNSIEDSILAGETSLFPLGMKVRRYFVGHGLHDGRIIKVTRKMYDDEDRDKKRPVLVYRIRFNDDDQEDLLHHEICSLSQFYDRSNIDPESPLDVQIPPGTRFVVRSGHTIEVIRHKAPSNAKDSPNVVFKVVNHSSESSPHNHQELDILKLEKAVVRKVTDPTKVAATEMKSPGTPSSAVDMNEMAATLLQFANPHRAPVLEWPHKKDKDSKDDDSEQHDICEGLTLHRKRCNTSPNNFISTKMPTTSILNNPRDVRPGCKPTVWDPAACMAHLSWDPYASTFCDICGIDKDDNLIIICDECHTGFHTYCLRPVMVNIPKGDWLCHNCAPANSQVPFDQYCKNMSGNNKEIFGFLDLPYKNPNEFFRIHSDAIQLSSLDSQGAVKQKAISLQVAANNVVFDVGNVKFIRAPEKNDWRLPAPLLSKKEYTSSILSMVAAMKYCGMESNLSELSYKHVSEEMNDPSLETDAITPMSRRNLEIFRAFKHNVKQGVYPPVEIVYDENFGFSCKSLAAMPRHTLIGDYLGEVVTVEQSAQSNSDSLMVLLDSGDPKTSLIIDPTDAGNIARFLSGVNNRSLMSKRKANVRTRRFFMDGKIHVALFTSRRVEAGEVLNYDYNAGNEGKDVSRWASSGFYDTSNFF